ncbi:MAG TPA: M48 family metallopeptidase [Gemmatimonadaceae bacterium]|nr:M48 family metallopeptidase [Gemmatimonadaceae bacterium]
MSEPVNLFAQQQANRRRSFWLVASFIVFFAWLGFGGDWILHELTTNGPTGGYRHQFPWIGLIMVVVGGGISWHAWSAGPSEILWSVGAREVLKPATPAEALYVNVSEEMAIAAGVPRPRLWIIPDADPNALATGRGPDSASIAVTDGLLELCSRDELQAVVAHEIAHIKSYDVRLMTMLAGLVGAVVLMGDGMMRLIIHGGLRGGRSSGRGGGGRKGNLGPLIVLALVLWVVSWLVAPIVSRLLALGVSRKREYLADAMAAQFTRNPLALATALEKIEHAATPTYSIKRGAAHLCIADPLGRRLTSRDGWLADMMATHPPMGMRISRLRGMGYRELKHSGGVVPAT